LDIELIQALNLNPKTQRSSINFMGCNAAIIALNQANSICNSQPNAKVLIVCTELCTIHIQNSFTDDYLLSNSLFSDGSAAAMVSSKPQHMPEYRDLEITSFDSLIIHEGQNDMAWQLSEYGFLMSLSAYISNLINGNISKMLSDLNIQKDKINFWAIHPGGKKILDDFAKVFDFKNNELVSAYHVLKNYGNMSSPTILFVLKELMKNNEKKRSGDTIFTAAFGPGLTIETNPLSSIPINCLYNCSIPILTSPDFIPFNLKDIFWSSVSVTIISRLSYLTFDSLIKSLSRIVAIYSSFKFPVILSIS
jgi:predicted naringenin-chalcone synthase